MVICLPVLWVPGVRSKGPLGTSWAFVFHSYGLFPGPKKINGPNNCSLQLFLPRVFFIYSKPKKMRGKLLKTIHKKASMYV